MAAERRRLELRSAAHAMMSRGARVPSVVVLAVVALGAWIALGAAPAAQLPAKDSAPAVGQLSIVRLAAAGCESALAARRSAEGSERTAIGARLRSRARSTDADGSPRPALLAASRVEPFADAGQAVRALLERHARRHLPYGEPSSFYATAPPSTRRGG